MSDSFGIPLSSGRLLSRGKSGCVMQFNLRCLNPRLVVRAQVYSSNREGLTEVAVPLPRATDVFQYPGIITPLDFAFAQKESMAIAYFSNRLLEHGDIRIVFWFFRYPQEVISNNDYLDIPNEALPLLLAEMKREILKHIGKPVPPELDEEVKREESKLGKTLSAVQNYYLTDTFVPTAEQLALIATDEQTQATNTSDAKPTKTGRGYVPNQKYRERHHKRFQQLWDKMGNQVLAYDKLVTENPRDLDPDGFDNYIRRFRDWNKDQATKAKPAP